MVPPTKGHINHKLILPNKKLLQIPLFLSIAISIISMQQYRVGAGLHVFVITIMSWYDSEFGLMGHIRKYKASDVYRVES